MREKVLELTEQYLEGKLTADTAADALLNFITLYYEE
jgi:predicted metal-binding protein